MSYIIGLDEVGYGAWAGPLVIGAIRAPIDWQIDGLRDSKKIKSREQKAKISKTLIDLAEKDIIRYRLEIFSNDDIDRLGLAACHKIAYARAVNALYNNEDKVIIDGNIRAIHFANHGMKADLKHVNTEVKADDKYPVVMAASILAKNYRDNLMIECHKTFPQYGWDENVGYIVSAHREAVVKCGLSCLHRKSYNVKL